MCCDSNDALISIVPKEKNCFVLFSCLALNQRAYIYGN